MKKERLSLKGEKNMKVLSIDSSRYLGSVGIIDGSDVKFSITFSVKATYSQKLLSNIDYALESSKMDIDDIDLIGIAKGPGSFTGLRIGMTVAKSLSYVKNIPIVGINTLKSITYRYMLDGNIYIPIFDARRNQVFSAAFKKKDNNISTEIKTSACYLIDFLEKLKKYEERKIFLGESKSKYSEIIDKNFKKKEYVDDNYSTTDPIFLAKLAKKRYEQKGSDSLLDLEPSYFRKSDAQINYEKNKDS